MAADIMESLRSQIGFGGNLCGAIERATLSQGNTGFGVNGMNLTRQELAERVASLAAQGVYGCIVVKTHRVLATCFIAAPQMGQAANGTAMGRGRIRPP